MRYIGCILLQLLSCFATHAQGIGDTLSTDFDGSNVSLAIDAVSSDGLWQVGAPNKSVFIGAWSSPNVLVTDTINPYPDNTTSFAEFTIALDEPGLGIDFLSWTDTEGPESFGRLETLDPVSQEWEPVITGSLTTLYDHLFLQVYDGSSDGQGHYFGSASGWTPVHLEAYCVGVFQPHELNRGGGQGSFITRFRFAFYSGDALRQHDGWMIDDLKATPLGCTSGSDELLLDEFDMNLDGSGASLTIRTPGNILGPDLVRIIASDGRQVLATNFNSSCCTVDVSPLRPGVYLCVLQRNGRSVTKRFVLGR